MIPYVPNAVLEASLRKEEIVESLREAELQESLRREEFLNDSYSSSRKTQQQQQQQQHNLSTRNNCWRDELETSLRIEDQLSRPPTYKTDSDINRKMKLNEKSKKNEAVAMETNDALDKKALIYNFHKQVTLSMNSTVDDDGGDNGGEEEDGSYEMERRHSDPMQKHNNYLPPVQKSEQSECSEKGSVLSFSCEENSLNICNTFWRPSLTFNSHQYGDAVLDFGALWPSEETLGNLMQEVYQATPLRKCVLDVCKLALRCGPVRLLKVLVESRIIGECNHHHLHHHIY